MEIIERKFKGVFEIILSPHIDERGFFMRTYDDKIFKENGLVFNWVQENHSRSIKKGIVRGLHFQFPPYVETKLVRCIRGKIFDVFVDLRKDSPTFGFWDSITLDAERFNSILIPRGFAHGFCTLSKYSEIVYKVDNYYSKEHESGLLWNDPSIGIRWPISDDVIMLSDRDKKHMLFKEFELKFKNIKNQ